MPTIDREYVVNTLRDLVRINSINPSLVAGAPGEARIAAYVADTLRALGLEVQLHEPEPGRVSVVGRWKGTGGGRSLMLNGHIDTVGVEGMPEPFSGAVRDGKLFGRGSYDMKGSVAACIGCVQALSRAGLRLPGDVLVAAVADEEYASLGTADVARRYKVDGAIVTEPSALQVCIAHKGFAWLEVETIGRAYHGSQFRHGIDANLRMGRVLAELDTLERELRNRTPHPMVGPPSMHAATLHGGTGLSTYSASCTLQIERRTIPGETEVQVVAEVQSILDRLAASDPTFKATVRTLLVRSAFEVSPDAPIVRALEGALVSVTGRQPTRIGENPWMDSALLADAGVEAVVCGPNGTGAHADEEWVDLQTVFDMSQVLVEAATSYCVPAAALPTGDASTSRASHA